MINCSQHEQKNRQRQHYLDLELTTDR